MKTNAAQLAYCMLWLLVRGDVFGQTIGQEDHADFGAVAGNENGAAESEAASADPSRRALRKREKKSKSNESPKERVVVRYKNAAGKAALLLQQSQAGGSVYHDFDDENVLVLDLDADTMQVMALSEDIDSVEEDGVYEALGHVVRELGESEADRKLAETTPYGITMVQADQVPIGPYGVKVCVADTGVRRHPDLPSTMAGKSRTSSMGKAVYWDGAKIAHGTHAAGTVAAVKGNGIGVMGVAAGASLYITRAIDDAGYARESDVMQSVKDCADWGAQVISLSLGGSSMSSSFKAYVDKLYFEQDIVIVAAAGNDGKKGLKYPAAHSTVVAVGALSSDYSLWGGSNWGSGLEVVAPGNLVLSTAFNGNGDYVYQLWSGTSMATPHVAGVAALLRSYYPECSNNQIRFAMAFTARDLDDATSDSSTGCDARFGYGVVQAKTALDFLRRYSCATTWGRNAPLGGCSVTKRRNRSSG